MGWIIAAIGLMGGLLGWYNKITIENALAVFREGLRKEFKDQFMNAELAEEKLKPIHQNISNLENWIRTVEGATDENTTAIQILKVKIDAK